MLLFILALQGCINCFFFFLGGGGGYTDFEVFVHQFLGTHIKIKSLYKHLAIGLNLFLSFV